MNHLNTLPALVKAVFEPKCFFVKATFKGGAVMEVEAYDEKSGFVFGRLYEADGKTYQTKRLTKSPAGCIVKLEIVP